MQPIPTRPGLARQFLAEQLKYLQQDLADLGQRLRERITEALGRLVAHLVRQAVQKALGQVPRQPHGRRPPQNKLREEKAASLYLPEKPLATRPAPPQRRSKPSRGPTLTPALPWWLGPCRRRPLITTLGLGLAAVVTLGGGRLLAAGAGLVGSALSQFTGSAVARAIATTLAQALTT
jgi:hypothetical protein